MNRLDIIFNFGKKCRVNDRGDFAMDAEKGVFIGSLVTLIRLTKGGLALCQTHTGQEVSFPPKNIDLIPST
jgi:hypothetical protein